MLLVSLATRRDSKPTPHVAMQLGSRLSTAGGRRSQLHRPALVIKLGLSPLSLVEASPR